MTLLPIHLQNISVAKTFEAKIQKSKERRKKKLLHYTIKL